MNSLLSFIKKMPLWLWVIVALAILLLVNQISASIGNRSMFNLVLDQIRTDQSGVVQTLEQNMKGYEAEIQRLTGEIDIVRQGQSIVRAENERLRGVVSEKDAEIIALRRERETIIVSTDPDVLVNDLRGLGFRSARKQTRD